MFVFIYLKKPKTKLLFYIKNKYRSNKFLNRANARIYI